MASAQENETLTRVGPGTPMGALMRQYWLPAALSSEVVADGAPLRLMLLGEKLVAFRDSNGKVGVMDHRCPHRCASLFFGRNEEGGLRCVYHGWKFDADGNCIEMPNVPDKQTFAHRVHAKAYKTAERAGVLWVYMGDQSNVPDLPAIEATMLDESELDITVFQRNCNWLQSMEGDIDTSHVDFLHGGGRTLADFAPDDIRQFGALSRNPEFSVTDTDWGTMYGAHRAAWPGQKYWRVAQFVLPFWSMAPSWEFDTNIMVRASVPMDDEHTMTFGWRKKGQMKLSSNDGNYGLFYGEAVVPTPAGVPNVHLPNTTDWFGRWRYASNASNDYGLDRDAMKTMNFTGITGVILQDTAMAEGGDTILDRSLEHLAASDRMIVVTRRRLLRVAEALAKSGDVPLNAADPSICYGARAGYYACPETSDLMQGYGEQLTASRSRSAVSEIAG